ncbi:MAG: glycosyltransferase family 2 protein [Pyrinomonadaceae bacterium]|nr:glycosyltransferase family 2 protein [Pyrinomonadaceae bacterium]
MKFSVAMCTYDGARFIQDQLDSIEKQTRIPDELVICDDKSSDDTRDIIKSFAIKAPFPVRLEANETNIGSTKSFEKAIKLCQGEIIALSDQDDVWHPDKLMSLESSLLSSPNAGLVFSDAEVVDEDLRPLGIRLWSFFFSSKERQLFKSGQALDLLLEKPVVTGATMAFRAEYKNLILPIPTGTQLIHDAWIALMIATVADLAFIGEPLVMYRQHPMQQTGLFAKADSIDRKDSASRQECFENLARSYLRETDLFGRVLKQLQSRSDVDRKKQIKTVEAKLACLNRMVAHYKARAAANAGAKRLSRTALILKELLTFRYHLCSKGTLSAVRDLLA